MAQKEQDRPFWTEILMVLGLHKFVAIFIAVPKEEIREVTTVSPLSEKAVAAIKLDMAKAMVACSNSTSWVQGCADESCMAKSWSRRRIV